MADTMPEIFIDLCGDGLYRYNVSVYLNAPGAEWPRVQVWGIAAIIAIPQECRK